MPQPGWHGPTTLLTGRADFTPFPGSIATLSATCRGWKTCIFWSRTAPPSSARAACWREPARNSAACTSISGPPTGCGLRDSGPIFVARRGSDPVAITNWRFNAWAKYKDWQLDDQIPLKAAELLHLPSWTPEFPGRRPIALYWKAGVSTSTARGL